MDSFVVGAHGRLGNCPMCCFLSAVLSAISFSPLLSSPAQVCFFFFFFLSFFLSFSLLLTPFVCQAFCFSLFALHATCPLLVLAFMRQFMLSAPPPPF